jgi:hypothetical protein
VRLTFATALLLTALWCQPSTAQTGPFEIRSDQRSTSGGTELCLAVDAKRQLVPQRGVNIIPEVDSHLAPGAKPIPVTGVFHPVIVSRCDQLTADLPSRWTATDTRELQIKVGNQTMCLSARVSSAFLPLLDSFLRAFDAFKPDSPYAYLAANLMPNGKPNAAQLRGSPDLVVSDCRRSDAIDFWVYDDVTGTISGPAGKGTQRCVAIHGDPTKQPVKYESGMPAIALTCGELRSYSRAHIPPQQRWSISAGKESLPTYRAPDLKEYYSGADGLPIVGPMGRCLTADTPSKHVVTSDCDGRVQQKWRYLQQAIQLGQNGECLTHEADGAVTLSACRSADNQKWRYRVRDDRVPNPKWLNSDVYAQIRPAGDDRGCLVVTDDPFVDPVRQRNRVTLAPCQATKPRQTSWFLTIRTRTVRLALLRNADDDGKNASIGFAEAEIKPTMEKIAQYMSEQYAVLGLRFVFDPEHDYMLRKDTVANQAHNVNPDGTTNWTSAIHNTGIAASTFNGKLTYATMTGYAGGGASGGYTEFEPDRIREPISRQTVPDYRVIPGLPKDKNGLPAISYYIALNSIGDGVFWAGIEAHEMGHYFGLGHTFNQDEFADTPDDLKEPTAWQLLGTAGCGNARTVTVDGKRYTPDRDNNEGYFGCNIGRAHASFSPVQLGYMYWNVNNQLNRYILVACQPPRGFDANHVECENASGLALCEQTSAYLLKKYDTTHVCQIGGEYRRAIAADLQYPAVMDLLQATPPGQQLLKRLAGNTASTAASKAAFDAALEQLRECTNLPLTMAVVTRLKEFRDILTRSNPDLAKKGFDPKGGPLNAADHAAIVKVAGQVFTPGFITNVPTIVAH